MNNNKQQQQDDDSYSESDHQHNEQYNLIGNDAPESSAEWSNNSSKELDNYNNIGKSVFFQNNSLLTWNTKTAPKIFVHCNVQHAFMVATNPAGSSEGSSSCSASTKKKMRHKKKDKSGENLCTQDSGPVPASQPTSAALSSEDQQGQQNISASGLACQQGLSDQHGVLSDMRAHQT